MRAAKQDGPSKELEDRLTVELGVARPDFERICALLKAAWLEGSIATLTWALGEVDE